MEMKMNNMEKDEAADDSRTIVFISKTGGRFEVSRASLLQTSDYYQALVKSGMRDARFSDLALEFLSDDSLQEVREFLLSPRCSEEENEKCSRIIKRLTDIKRGLEGASYLQINDMKTLYLKYLLRYFNETSYVRLMKFAKKYASVEDMEMIYDSLMMNFRNIAKHPKIMPYNVLFRLVKSELVNADSDFDILKIIIDWISAKESRRSYAEKLLKNVRFDLMCTEEKQKSAEAIKKMELDVPLTERTSNCHRGVGRLFALVNNNTDGFNSECYSVSLFDFVRTCDSRKSTTPPVVKFNHIDRYGPRDYYEQCTYHLVNYRLYMVGGERYYYMKKRTLFYDLKSCKWGRLADMGVARSNFFLGNIGKYLYAVAGFCCHGEVERFNPDKNRWSWLAPLPIAVSGLAGCVHNGMIYVSGGYRYGDEFRNENRVWQYDPAFDVWSEKCPMLSRRRGHVMAFVGDVLLVVGGGLRKSLMNGEMYDFATDQWTYVLKLKMPVLESPSILFNNCLYIFTKRSYGKPKNLYIQKINLKKYLNNTNTDDINITDDYVYNINDEDDEEEVDDEEEDDENIDIYDMNDNYDDNASDTTDENYEEEEEEYIEDNGSVEDNNEEDDVVVDDAYDVVVDDAYDVVADENNVENSVIHVVDRVSIAVDEDFVDHFPIQETGNVVHNDDFILPDIKVDDDIINDYDDVNVDLINDDDDLCQIYKFNAGKKLSTINWIGMVNMSTDL
ncbi:hypothetical protein HELRODRAFT_180027 [Helobdella robusta]|uniref:BACK domain-containing protein n=1 Tax=Helobdella robusta TaxID=6412 RepID=T1FFD1_HELRO|nr:hypothetical protein HELRODRAFT_180027 [Helobdella robusta]ESN94920.1 hypothetical protein HELRODRAFT_180027 [Helobdella robusta]